jgi:hypothetical protein
MGKLGAFIQSNTKQILGAKIAKYALETRGGLHARGIPVSIIKVEEVPVFRAFEGKPYRKGYAPFSLSGDLQSFTMTRFMPPELMGYEGRALVIDPDIFALSDVGALFDIDLNGAGIAACAKKDAWDTSVMVLDNTKLPHWKIANMLDAIATGTKKYEDFAQLRAERNKIKELPRIWNNLDTLTPETKMIHTTNRLTQPWKTGLPIDFTFNSAPKLFGILPRFWVKNPTHYQPHPDKNIEKLFFSLLKEALEAGAVDEAEIDAAIAAHNVRKDAKELLKVV